MATDLCVMAMILLAFFILIFDQCCNLSSNSIFLFKRSFFIKKELLLNQAFIFLYKKSDFKVSNERGNWRAAPPPLSKKLYEIINSPLLITTTNPDTNLNTKITFEHVRIFHVVFSFFILLFLLNFQSFT